MNFGSQLRTKDTSVDYVRRSNYACSSGHLIYRHPCHAVSVEYGQVPKQVHMHAEELFQLPYLCVAGAEIPRVMKAMLQWLRSHDLARFFVEDVDVERVRGYKRVSWGGRRAPIKDRLSSSVPR